MNKGDTMNRVTITKEQKPWDDYQGAFENGKFIYYDFLEDENGEWIKDKKYSFRFTDEKFHQYETLIVTPKVLVVLSNETGLSEKELKKYISEIFFLEVNNLAREHRNKKARERRAKQNGQTN